MIVLVSDSLLSGKSTLLTALLSEFSYFPTSGTTKPLTAPPPPAEIAAAPLPPAPAPAAGPRSQSRPPVPQSSTGGGRVVSLSSGKDKDKSKRKGGEDSDAALAEDVQSRSGVVIRGSCFAYHNLRVALVSQHHIDAMSDHLLTSPLAYATALLGDMIAQSVRLGFRSFRDFSDLQ